MTMYLRNADHQPTGSDPPECIDAPLSTETPGTMDHGAERGQGGRPWRAEGAVG